MAHWLATRRTAQEAGWIKRFDPRFWTVDFPRPMMASVTAPAPATLRAEAVFYRRDDLAGLIWEAEDRWDHPLLAYETSRDFRRCTLAFRWRSVGVKPLDALHGPTLTIEGRDAAGQRRAWYVRLWNYAKGTPEDAAITLDFAALEGGFLLPGEADPVWAGDVDRMFVSLVAPAYDASAAPLAAPAEGWVELSGITCDGSGSTLAIGDVVVPPHGLAIATGYDDAYNQTPERLLRQCLQLGYRDIINHYVGMSHYFRLERAGEGLYASLQGGALNRPCAAWHRAFAAGAKTLGYELILSLSFELFEAHCWNDWKQRAADGSPALTGYTPPSALLSPAHPGAVFYLGAVARAFAAIARDTGLTVRFQVGEPWWWVTLDGRICLYDDAARAAFEGNPVLIESVRAPLNAAQRALLDQAGALLAAATAAVIAAVRAEAPSAEALLLVYLPSALDPLAPEVRRANLPLGWAKPAFDVLQLEDYEWVTGGAGGRTEGAIATAAARLGYPVSEQHYLAGFAATPADWPAIDAAAEAARRRGTARTFIWALPQVARHGFTQFRIGEDDMDAFDDVSFPLAIGREAVVAPSFSTAIVETASGHERRNADWADARLAFDAGPGVRSEADIARLIAFFRARHGPARAFRFRDPFDHDAVAEPLGIGDGARTEFALVKRYGDQVRRIALPVPDSVSVTVDGVAATGWRLGEGGTVLFDVPPPAGTAIAASFTFDVPVRFAEDRLEVSRATFLAGEAASVPLVEVRQ